MGCRQSHQELYRHNVHVCMIKSFVAFLHRSDNIPRWWTVQEPQQQRLHMKLFSFNFLIYVLTESVFKEPAFIRL